MRSGATRRCLQCGTALADDWPKALQSQGFTSSATTVWLIDGLLRYIVTLSAEGSVLLYNVVGKTLPDAPLLPPTLQLMWLGAPWTFGTEKPTALVEGRGWITVVTDVAEQSSDNCS
jgi:O-methyltransferase involved in polyketide biosynthesis